VHLSSRSPFRRAPLGPTVTTTLAAALAAGVVLCPRPAAAEEVPPRLLEASLLVAFGEGLGRAPLVMPLAGLELGIADIVGLSASGGVLVATREALSFLESTEVGGGVDVGVRLYLRGRWPRGFAVGAAASMMVAGGVAIFLPRAELGYRWILLEGLALKAHLALGGTFVWDSSPQDDRAGPEGGGAGGLLMGFGVGIGWASGG